MAIAAPAEASVVQIHMRSLRPLMPSIIRPRGRRARLWERLTRVAPDVSGEGGLACILPLLDVDLRSARVVDRRRGSADGGVDHLGDVLVGVGVARIGHRELAQELL